MTACGSVGALTVGGRVVGQLKCDLDDGHDEDRWDGHGYWGGDLSSEEYAAHNRAGGPPLDRIEPTPHRVVLEWEDAEPVDLDLFDPDEHFDVDVPVPEAPQPIEFTSAFRAYWERVEGERSALIFPPTDLDRADLYGEE